MRNLANELMTLPGVGEVMANHIIEGRPYVTLKDLSNVEGIGPKTLEKLMKYVRIGDP